MLTKLYAIDGMFCENCVSRVNDAFNSIPVVADVKVLLDSGQAVIRLQEPVDLNTINIALQHVGGYSARESNEAIASKEKKKKTFSFFKLFKRNKSCCQ